MSLQTSKYFFTLHCIDTIKEFRPRTPDSGLLHTLYVYKRRNLVTMMGEQGSFKLINAVKMDVQTLEVYKRHQHNLSQERGAGVGRK